MGRPDRALVYGVDSQIGLSIVRELAEHGVEVFGVGLSRRAVGLFSRALRRGWVAQGGDDPVDVVNRIAAEHDIPFLLTVGEVQINQFNAGRGRLANIRPLIPAADKMAVVLDKGRVSAIASELGISVPAMHEVNTPSDIPALVRRLSYPVVLKWANPVAIADSLRQHGLPLDKFIYCQDAGELRRVLHRFDKVGRYPLIQSYAPGYGLGQMFFMHDGKALLRFQHRRLHEWPPEGGAASYCESLSPDANAALAEKSLALLQRIGWEGAAMVEFRQDPATGKAVLMEINGRFWGSLPLAHHAGAPFAWLTYAVLGKGERPAISPYRVGLRCSFLTPELKRLHRILFRPDLVQDRTLRFSRFRSVLDFLLAELSPNVRRYIFRWSDPLPALADAWLGLAEALKSFVRRRRRASA